MNNWTFDPKIAETIVSGRILRLPTLRAIAESNGVRMSDLLWEQLEPRWIWHNEMSSEELQRRCGISS